MLLPFKRLYDGAGSAAATGALQPTWAWRASDLSLAPYIGSGTPTVTRAGNTATRINSSGLIETVNENLARYDYSLAGVLQGLLVEPAATNIALRNNDLTNAVWVKGATVSVAKDQTGPDGVANSASLITGGAVAGTNTVLQTVVLASSVRKMSAYVKRVTGSGTIEMTTNGGTNWDAIVPTSSWARYDIAVRTVTNPSFGFRVNTNGDQIAVAFIQNETDVLTSPTTEVAGTAVTRAADYISLATSSLGGFNASAGSLYTRSIKTATPTAGFYPVFASLNDGTTNNDITLFGSGDDATTYLLVRSGGVIQAQPAGGANATTQESMGAWAANDFAYVADGGTVGTDAAGSIPTVTTLVLGTVTAASTVIYLRGWLTEVEYYAQRTSNAFIDNRTTA